MEQLLKQIEDYKKEISSFSAADEKQVEEFRIKYLGTKGIVKAIMGEMKNVPVEKKKEAGQLLNEFKQFAEGKYEELKATTSGSEQSASGIDLTLPGDELPLGSRHPVTLMRNRLLVVTVNPSTPSINCTGAAVPSLRHKLTSSGVPPIRTK